jgi:peptidoglycan/xylan/chitin deacetylase (PgdA/CDA1 family)
MSLKRALRRAAATTVGGLGLARPLARLTGGRAAILAYHRVLDPAVHDLEAVEPGMFVTRDAFAEHIALLQERYAVASLADLARRLYTGERVEWGTVVITFDDGWLDTYEAAYPILRAAGLPATLFVPTGAIDTGARFWFSRATDAVKELWENREILSAAFPDEDMPPEARFVMELLIEDPPRPQYFTRVMQNCKTLPEQARARVVDFLEMIAGPRPTKRPELVNWDQLRRMSADVFEIGSHTAGHRIMTQLDDDEVRRELDESRRRIADEIGETPISFCYPNGDHNDKIARLVARAGYACATTTRHGFANPPADLYALPRLGMHQGVAPDAHGLALLLSGIG